MVAADVIEEIPAPPPHVRWLEINVTDCTEFPDDGFVRSFGKFFRITVPEFGWKAFAARLRKHGLDKLAYALKFVSAELTIDAELASQLRTVIRGMPGLIVSHVWMHAPEKNGQWAQYWNCSIKTQVGGRWELFDFKKKF